MTACTNKARGAVVAALAGALALGAAPAVALATTGDVSLQFAQGSQDGETGTEWVNGDVTLVFGDLDDNPGTNITTSTDADGFTTVTADQIPFTVTANSVTPAGTSTPIKVTPGNDYKVALYKADADGKPTGTPLSGNRVIEAGDYVLTVTPLTGSDYVGQTFTRVFKVVGKQITAQTPYEGTDDTDKHLVFTGSALDLNFLNNDEEELVAGKDYTVKYSKGGKTYDSVVDAGTYTATLTGLGKYAGTSTTTAPFLVNAYTLESGSTIVVEPFKGDAPVNPTRVFFDDGVDAHYTELDASLIGLEPTSQISGAGQYTFKITVDQDLIDSGNIQYPSELTTTAVKVDEFASFLYNGQELQDSYDILPGQTFNANAVTTTYNGTSLGAVGDGYTTVTPNLSVLTNNGASTTYKLTYTYNAGGVKVNNPGNALDGKVLSATKTVTVRFWKGAIDADTDLWVYGPDYATKPVAINSYEKAYDGEPLTASSFYVTNKDASVTSLNGGLNVALYDSEGNEVDQAVDAGTYTLRVTSDDYLLSGTTELTITIGKVDLNSARVGNIVKWNGVAGEEYLQAAYPYDFNTNFRAIQTLGLVYDTGNEGATYDDKDYDADDFKGEDRLPDNVDVVVERNDGGTWKPVANPTETGDYRVILTVGDDVAANYEGTTKTIEFKVSAPGYFKDVQPSDWFFGAVQRAFNAGYMNGTVAPTLDDSDTPENEFRTGTFTPQGTVLTRGEVACVLYNVSGADMDETDSAYYDKETGWKTGFSDVEGGEFYAEAVAWAKSAGVINGYGDGTFGGNRGITREEFACMLANFAQNVLGDEDVAKDNSAALEAMPDADQVTGWAKDSVAWAVSKKVMGNDGRVSPTVSMDRATCASMVVNYMDPDAEISTDVLTKQQLGR